MAAQTTVYTAEQVAEMEAAYKELPTQDTVEALAEKFGKSTKSIIARLSRSGVYQKKQYVSKAGEKPQDKDTIADAIGAVLKLDEASTASLAKANKKALQAIFLALANSQPL